MGKEFVKFLLESATDDTEGNHLKPEKLKSTLMAILCTACSIKIVSLSLIVTIIYLIYSFTHNALFIYQRNLHGHPNSQWLQMACWNVSENLLPYKENEFLIFIKQEAINLLPKVMLKNNMCYGQKHPLNVLIAPY